MEKKNAEQVEEMYVYVYSIYSDFDYENKIDTKVLLAPKSKLWEMRKLGTFPIKPISMSAFPIDSISPDNEEIWNKPVPEKYNKVIALPCTSEEEKKVKEHQLETEIDFRRKTYTFLGYRKEKPPFGWVILAEVI